MVTKLLKSVFLQKKIIMTQAILFPFSISESNEERYNAAQEAAKEHQLPLIFFTSIPQKSGEDIKDSIYLHLLKLRGQYHALTNSWSVKAPIGTKTVIKKGNLEKQLELFITSSATDLILVD